VPLVLAGNKIATRNRIPDGVHCLRLLESGSELLLRMKTEPPKRIR
jgi:hypothetical protein